MSDEQLRLFDRYYNICLELGYLWPTMNKDIQKFILND